MGILDVVNNAINSGLESGRLDRINKAYSLMMQTKTMADSINAAQAQRFARYKRGKASTWNIFAKMLGSVSYIAYKANARKQKRWNNRLTQRQSYLAGKEAAYQKIYGHASGVGGVAPAPKNSQAVFSDPNLAQRKSAAASAQKRFDPLVYKSTSSDLEPAVIVDKNGNAIAEYKHFNASAREIEIDVKNPSAHPIEFENVGGKFSAYKRAKMNLKVNDKLELDLSLPENAQFVKNPDRLRDILREHPEAYKTIPQSYFGPGGLKRNDVLDMVKEGVKDKVTNPSKITMYERDSSGNSIGKRLGAKEFVEQMYNDVIDKDNEILTYAQIVTYAKTIAEMKNKAQHAKSHSNSAAEVDDFFAKAKI